MKKIICLLLALMMIFALASCGDSSNDSTSEQSGEASNISTEEKCDVDLTKLSSTMVYSEVYNMMSSPEDYLGKTVKMSGNFGIYQDQTTNQLYFACLIADAASCCSQGIEFVLEGDYTFPDDYPEINSIITVTGIFDTYEENGYIYCQLINAKMEA